MNKNQTKLFMNINRPGSGQSEILKDADCNLSYIKTTNTQIKGLQKNNSSDIFVIRDWLITKGTVTKRKKMSPRMRT
jgi:hypothetical protein